jgi:hypothetical protein
MREVMAFEARVLSVLIASPSDTREARDVVEQAILSWNRDRTKTTKVNLLPQRWEVDAVPEMGGDPQSIVNRQLVDDADIVIALFHTRLGLPTTRATSGTVEEIERSQKNGARVHVFFSEMPLPYNHDPKQFEAVRAYRTELSSQGLLGTYVSVDDLTAKARACLDHDVESLTATAASGETRVPLGGGEPKPRAVLRTEFKYEREPDVDSRGKMRMKTRRERFEVQNIGDGAAENVRLTFEPIGDGEVPFIDPSEPEAERIPERAHVSFLAARSMGTASQVRVTYRWTEDGWPFTDSQTVGL